MNPKNGKNFEKLPKGQSFAKSGHTEFVGLKESQLKGKQGSKMMVEGRK